ncbi:Uncharacterized membrane protein [Halopseudomonas xinjiangensis]|uniref:Uncharacterized membrane protein n=1 Tax=Halopseudomonas xinjiangensis TaxID=487184 RepID=A0A1H1LEX8_9GAMM|nr:Uncharacterized membrane protein [Halopseudomonas xinjiangensis]
MVHLVSGISQQGDARRSFWYAVLVGIGVMAAVDEIVFHQLLQWHHFVDLATPFIGILSDGVLHAIELLATAVGFVLLVGLARERMLHVAMVWAGVLMGSGGFQLFDGVVNHKILRIHQVRYGVDPLLYDLTWNAVGIALLVVGFCVLSRFRREGRDVAR